MSLGYVTSIQSSNANGASVSYTYDDLNRLSTVVDHRLPGQNTTTYTYDPASNLATAAYPNGVQSIMTYDALNRITGLAASSSAAEVSGYTYQRGPTGNLTSATELNGRTVNWSFDGVCRLTSEAVSSDPSKINGNVAYGLDPVGNRLSDTSSNPDVPSGSYGYNADDEVTSETYDANGNVLSTGGRAFTYDSENHLMTMTTTGTMVSIIYDGDGNRVSKTVNGVTTSYLVDDLNPTGYAQVVEELAGGVVSRQYTHGLQRINENQVIDNVWTPSFYGYDGGGNVRQLTNSAGAVTDQFEYDAFGNSFAKVGTTPNNYLYRGEQYDPDLGLYYLRARYYNPNTGRFMSRDPEEGTPRIPATLHKYLYVGANPIRFVDPTGRSAAEYGGVLTLAALIGAELGPEVNIEGTVEVSEGTAVMTVNLIEGVVRNPFGIMTLLTEAATALEASELYIVTTFANPVLQNIAIQRYGFVTVGGVEVWHAFL